MKIAILVFDKLTVLDAIGPYEAFASVPGWEVTFVSPDGGPVDADSGSFAITPGAAMADVTEAEIFLVGGGEGNRPLLTDEAVLDWVRRIAATAKWTTSVCTGSLVLGAAGLLEGKRATCHWAFLDRLPDYGAEPTGERVVFDGDVCTAAGVSSGIDMALHLIGAELGDEMAQAVQLGIEYDPQPPHDTGSPEKAPDPIVTLVREAMSGLDLQPGGQTL